ncbi:MAG: hypothetical protein OEY89_14955 [Gammaproteobacteria bacterium]|nr:hypothetical protein [Gammaproteobacteria bacterium]
MRDDSLGLFWRDEPPPPKVPKEKVVCIPPEPVWLEPGYLPHLAEARDHKYNLFTDKELVQASLDWDIAGKRHILIYDIECYSNYFLIGFKSTTLGKLTYLEMLNDSEMNMKKLKWLLERFCLVGFNNKAYDDTMALFVLRGYTNAILKEVSDKLIQEDARPSDLFKKYKVDTSIRERMDTIDIMSVAPGGGSLKVYAGRVHTKQMQDLPFDPSTVLNADQITILKWYCLANDLNSTIDLYNALKPQLELRESMSDQFSTDLRSMSDPQIAEKVLSLEIKKITGHWPKKADFSTINNVIRYDAPEFLKFESDLLKWVLNEINSSNYQADDSGKMKMSNHPKGITFNIAGTDYQVGVGGLHSVERCVHVSAGTDYILKDVDVESYYPAIILTQKLYPFHIGTAFLSAYEGIVNARLKAKALKNTIVSDSLKIVINSSFGKFGSMWSVLFAPKLMLQVTLTGQLSLLMLIERLELRGISIVSANTDGIVIKCPKDRESELNAIVNQWEQDIDFQTEETSYSDVYARDVNNYVAIKTDGSTKIRGVYRDPGLSKNPTTQICVKAATEFITKDIPVEETIRKCLDIRQFVSVKKVNGGAVKIWHNEDSTERIEYLGKVVRWYYANNMTTPIIYAQKGNKVGRSDGAKPMMLLPDTLPDDINYDWYINEANSILNKIGAIVE